jgi:hypothetical protein
MGSFLKRGSGLGAAQQGDLEGYREKGSSGRKCNRGKGVGMDCHGAVEKSWLVVWEAVERV